MSVAEYLDFEIEIGLGQGREYPLAVVRSPGGEAREQMIFPFDELALESRLKDLQIALLRSGGKHRQSLSPQESTIQEFGRKLFDALISGEIRSLYDVSQREAARSGLGMRIKLRIQPPELASLPWEFLYDGRRAEYICLSTQTPLVRYIELPQVIQPLLITPPLRILGLIASPTGLALLDTENEKQRMENALGELITAGQVQIDWLEHANRRELQRSMRRGPWHILHFIGHGGFDQVLDEGFIALENERGELDRLPATHLARLLADHANLRLAVLNSCDGAQGGTTDIFSSTASLLVRRGIPAVLAMQYEITDRAAIEFTRGFYEALADDLPVDAATAEARKSVSLGLTNTIEWGTPVLFMRASDGLLFKRAKLEEPHHIEVEQLTHPEMKKDLAEQVSKDGVEKLTAEKGLHQAGEHSIGKKAAHEQTKREQSLTLGEGVTLEFVHVPSGEFWMGADKSIDKQAEVNETPRHKIYLDEYLIGKTPVTNRQYRIFLQETGFRMPSHWQGGRIPAGREDHPVINVSWQDAVDFCQWASQVVGQIVRLPSEAEWEKAARGSLTGSNDERIYPWGNNPPDSQLANYGQNTGDTTQVGKYPAGASPYGAFDMAGNVWEWVADWYAENYYKNSPPSNPPGPESGQFRILRGGSWGNTAVVLRASLRHRVPPDFRDVNLGFRCVC